MQDLAVGGVEPTEVQALLRGVQASLPELQVADPAVPLVQGLRVAGLDQLRVDGPRLGTLALGVQRGVERGQVRLFGVNRIRQFLPLVLKYVPLVFRGAFGSWGK